MNRCEEELASESQTLTALEHHTSGRCVEVLKNIFALRNENLCGFSTLELLRNALRDEDADATGEAFWQELCHLFKGAIGQSEVYAGVSEPKFLSMTGREAGIERSRELARMSRNVSEHVRRYPHGLQEEIIKRREENRRRILDVLGGQEEDWVSFRWHLENIIRDEDTLGRIIDLTDEERAAIAESRQHHIPFAVTPYYASLMDREPGRVRDHAVRAQVIPSSRYVSHMSTGRLQMTEELDFMHERDTSPVELVTRRYPRIAIFKPFNTCAQICIYCQRNWEIEDAMAPGALADEARIKEALDWFRAETSLSEVLITGGDPLMMSDVMLDRILGEFAAMPHIERIRIGTRAPVVLPQRFTKSLLDIFSKYHTFERQLTLVTHFEHPYEVTPDARMAMQELRRLSIDIYNQVVFTIENSRKFETVALRLALKKIGVDPYYCFCAKGKEETNHFRVPIARILQERKEEARLTTGVVRTDEPVFNLPRLGKNYLRAGQDHHIIGIAADGGRVYEFLPWEKNLFKSPTYIHQDVPIHNYLSRLKKRGEDLNEYRNIWYYF